MLGPRRWRRLRERAAIPGERVRFYRRVVARAWIHTLVWLVAAWLTGAQLSDVGLRLPRSIGVASELVYALGFGFGLLAPVAIGPLRRATVRAFAPLAPLLPSTGEERAWFAGVALTAGFCEEMLYRSFALALVSRAAPAAPLWIWLVVGSVPFGLAHAYQGRKGIVLTTIVGLVATWLYLLFSSLWIPIVMHALIDLRAWLFSWWLPAAAAASSSAPSAAEAASDRAAV